MPETPEQPTPATQAAEDEVCPCCDGEGYTLEGTGSYYPTGYEIHVEVPCPECASAPTQHEPTQAKWVVDQTASRVADRALIEKYEQQGFTLSRFDRCDGANVYVFVGPAAPTQHEPRTVPPTQPREDGGERVPPLDAAPPDESLATTALDRSSYEECQRQGAWAYTFGKSLADNPYVNVSADAAHWEFGWRDAAVDDEG